jgi:beta-glucuronidase
MWSIANELRFEQSATEEYFKSVSEHARSFDNTRPITAAIIANYDKDRMSKFLDVLMVNRYFGWYSDSGFFKLLLKVL